MFRRPDPDVLLAGPLGQWLGGQAPQRASARVFVSTVQNASILFACATTMFLFLALDAGVWASLQVGFMVGSAGLGFGWLVGRGTVGTIKSGLNTAIADSLGLTYRAEAAPGSGYNRAVVFEMVKSHDTARFEDDWSGTLGAARFSLHEAMLDRVHGTGNEERTEPVFAGVIMTIAFTRQFDRVTLIERKGRHGGFLEGMRDSLNLNAHQLQRVTMTDPGFEDHFTVWGEDDVEARYLVHPAYVDRLIQLEQAFAGKNIRALFCDGELTVVLEAENLFESGSLDASEDRKLLELSIEQFSALAELAETLTEKPRAGFGRKTFG